MSSSARSSGLFEHCGSTSVSATSIGDSSFSRVETVDRGVDAVDTPERRAQRARRRHDRASRDMRLATMSASSSPGHEQFSFDENSDIGMPSTDPRRSPFATPLTVKRRTWDLERTRSDPGIERSGGSRPVVRSGLSFGRGGDEEEACHRLSIQSFRQQRDDEQDWIQLLEKQNEQLMEQISTLSRDVGAAERESRRELASALLEVGALREEMHALKASMEAQQARHSDEIAQFRSAAVRQKIVTSDTVAEHRELIDRQERQMADLERERQELVDTLKSQDGEILRLRRRVGALAEEMVQKKWLQSGTTTSDAARRDEASSSSRMQRRSATGLHTPMPSISSLGPSPLGQPGETPSAATRAANEVGSPLFSEFLPAMQHSTRSRIAVRPASWEYPAIGSELSRSSLALASPRVSSSSSSAASTGPSRASKQASAWSRPYDVILGLGIIAALWHTLLNTSRSAGSRLHAGLSARRRAWLRTCETMSTWLHFFIFLAVAISATVVEGPAAYHQSAKRSAGSVDATSQQADGVAQTAVHADKVAVGTAEDYADKQHLPQRHEEHRLQFNRRGSLSPSLLAIRSHSSPC